MMQDVVEDREAIMARFFSGLHRDISNIVELQHYVDLDEIRQKAIKVEKLFKRSRGANPNIIGTKATPWLEDETLMASTSKAKEALKEDHR